MCGIKLGRSEMKKKGSEIKLGRPKKKYIYFALFLLQINISTAENTVIYKSSIAVITVFLMIKVSQMCPNKYISVL